ncbi:MAG: DUF1064 domain-containing protein [Muribaculaceae bacterium]|nr:DUF1064 domain-containing protein [Muribaculaceae bacterium]
MARYTVEEYRRLAAQGKRPKASKYGAERTADGHASRKEARRARQLKLWEKAGLLSELREQVRYELIPAQYGDCGTDLKGRPVRVCLERACSYVADFVYRDTATGQIVVEDTKGVRTPEYVIKRKLMLYVHGIAIRET